MILGFWCSPLHWKCRADVTWGIMASHSLWKDSGHHHGNRSIRSYLIQKGQVKRVESRQASPHSQAKKIGSDKEVSLLLCAWLLATVCWHLWMEQEAILLESIYIQMKIHGQVLCQPPWPSILPIFPLWSFPMLWQGSRSELHSRIVSQCFSKKKRMKQTRHRSRPPASLA